MKNTTTLKCKIIFLPLNFAHYMTFRRVHLTTLEAVVQKNKKK